MTKWSSRLLILLALLALLLPYSYSQLSIVEAVAIETVYGEETTVQTHSGDTTFTAALTVASSSWTGGATYWLAVTAQVEGSDQANLYSFRTVHGTSSTVFTGSLFSVEPLGSGPTDGIDYFWQTRYTVPATPEDVVFQIRPENAAQEAHADTIVIFGLRLDELTEGTDYAYGENSTTTQHTTTFVDFATTTAFTPANNNDDWLVVGSATWLVDDIAINAQYRLSRDGETETEPEIGEEGEDTAEVKTYGLSRVFTLSNSAHSFSMQGRDDATGANDHEYSSVFALRLNAFEDHNFFWNGGAVFTQNDVYAEVASTTASVTQSGDFFVLASASGDNSGAGDRWNLRAQADGTTTPAGRDGTRDTRSQDSTDLSPFTTMFRSNFTSAVDMDVDGRTSDGGGADVIDRSLVVFSAELAAAAPEPPPAERRRPTLITEGSLRHWQIAA